MARRSDMNQPGHMMNESLAGELAAVLADPLEVPMDEAHLEFSRQGQRQLITIDVARMTVGRASGNDLSFPDDDTISGRHAVIERQASGCLIRDLGSTNGTYVNGQRLSGPQLLRPGDSITLGRMAMAFRAAPRQRGAGPWDEPGQAGLRGNGDTCSNGSERRAALASVPSGYLDVTGEWRRAAIPSARSVLDHAASRRPQPAGGGGAVGPLPVSAPGTGLPRASDPAERRRGHCRIRGIARGVQSRQGNNGMILSVRVERYDAVGNRMTPIGVEFKGYVGGHISDGEEVEVVGKWSRGTLEASKIVNLSTGAQVRGPSGAAKIIGCVVLALFLCAFTIVTIVIIIAFIRS
jgi:hypothetical protein